MAEPFFIHGQEQFVERLDQLGRLRLLIIVTALQISAFMADLNGFSVFTLTSGTQNILRLNLYFCPLFVTHECTQKKISDGRVCRLCRFRMDNPPLKGAGSVSAVGWRKRPVTHPYSVTTRNAEYRYRTSRSGCQKSIDIFKTIRQDYAISRRFYLKCRYHTAVKS